MQISIKNKVWWSYLEEDLQELLQQSALLLKTAERWSERLPNNHPEFHDYSFVVFPSAKAYEGFLKKLFLDMGFISEKEFLGKRFRVGKALNPALDRKYIHESVYKRIVDFCGGRGLADKLWNAWRECRNLLFHWFPKERNAISLSEAQDRFETIINAIDSAFKECKVGRK